MGGAQQYPRIMRGIIDSLPPSLPHCFIHLVMMEGKAGINPAYAHMNAVSQTAILLLQVILDCRLLPRA